jgi:phenylacetic acid degradation operon negative regulatory protein
VVIVTAAGDAADVRHDRRDRLVAARLGKVRDGVWMRPANLELALDGVPALLVLRSVPDADPAALAASIFDLEGWRRRAVRLIEKMDETPLAGAGDLAEGFVRNAEVLRHLQHDPLLPEELTGKGWPGPALRERYESFDAEYRVLLASSHRGEREDAAGAA